jgi:antitoxin ChpS
MFLNRTSHMFTTDLRQIGGSVMLAIPPAILDLLHLQAGSAVGLIVEGDRFGRSIKG